MSVGFGYISNFFFTIDNSDFNVVCCFSLLFLFVFCCFVSICPSKGALPDMEEEAAPTTDASGSL